jgi:hypothetical protein
MILYHWIEDKQKSQRLLAEIMEEFPKIKTVEHVLDFLGDCYYKNCIGIMIPKSVFDDTFYDLKTGLAGEILQKFSNYRMNLAIVGDFSNIESNSLRDFILESNKLGNINFVKDMKEVFETFYELS